MSHSTILIAAAIFSGAYILATLAYLAFRQYMRLRERELALEHAKMDDFRAHLERQLMELNLKFASSDNRWRELNHLVIAGQQPIVTETYTGRVRPSLFLRSHGIDADKIPIRSDFIFVLTPFHDNLLADFRTIVQVTQELGFKTGRGDETVTQGDIFPQLLRQMVEAKLVIANITGRNPNVFYELGIAHALDKPVILLAQNPSEVPFDIQSKQIVFYQSDDDLRQRLAQALTRTFAADSPNLNRR